MTRIPAIVAGVAALLATGCNTIQPAPSATADPAQGTLHIVNIDGPTTNISVNGSRVATIHCDEGLTLVVAAPPSELAVTDQAGHVLFHGRLTSPEQFVVIRADGAVVGVGLPQGGPAPLTSCAPP